ncbi:MAG: non-hydrolyzing UDP-N-acetylglucosamine 2-epimerase [Chloroflexota bacterium]
MVKVLRRENLENAVTVVVGTRPGIIKFSPVIRELRKRNVPFTLVHTGQHYSTEMDAVFFSDLQLPPPDIQLPSMQSLTLHGEQTAEMLRGVERALLETRPKAILVGGDANTNLSGALAARKLNIQVCHDEAGLRSYDWLMPEEHNRVIMDHISEFLFAPTRDAVETLQRECVRGSIHLTGTTSVDAVAQNRGLAEERSTVLRDLGLKRGAYILMTAHHEETVDYRETLLSLLEGARRIACQHRLPVVFPAHPRTRKRIQEFGLQDWLQNAGDIRLAPPLGYLDFLALHAGAALMMTDSGGGIQEACLLGVPCLTLGRATEWQGTVDVGANLVCGTEPESMQQAAADMLSRDRSWLSPFGPPGAAARLVDVIETEVLYGEGYLPARPEQPLAACAAVKGNR